MIHLPDSERESKKLRMRLKVLVVVPLSGSLPCVIEFHKRYEQGTNTPCVTQRFHCDIHAKMQIVVTHCTVRPLGSKHTPNGFMLAIYCMLLSVRFSLQTHTSCLSASLTASTQANSKERRCQNETKAHISAPYRSLANLSVL